MKDFRIGPLILGTLPRVVGTISLRKSFPSTCDVSNYTCDVVEVRLDEIGADTLGWVRECEAIEAANVPVILTLRLSSEGGKWTKPDEERKSVFSAALDSLSCIDVELTSKLLVPLCRQAEECDKCVIVSSHNFSETPNFSVLERILDQILDIPNAIPKISTMVNDESDVRTLMRLLDKVNSRPSCIIGMGSKGTKTRTLFPSLGTSLAYGYIDFPSAPGQLPSSHLIQSFRQLLPDYNQDVIIRKKIMECV